MAELDGSRIEPQQTQDCCIVGGGPGGMMLALLLVRRGLKVTLLESHQDFDRDFRGDTIHPSTLEIMNQLGLAEKLLELPHGKVRSFKIITATGVITLGEFGHLRTAFPYIMMLPQVEFLQFLAEQLKQYANFRLLLGATAQGLIQEQGEVCGVRYRSVDNQAHEIRALLIVGADGRFSKMRHQLGWEPIKTAPPMDVVWFRLPRKETDPRDEGGFYIQKGHMAVLLDRRTEWQIGYVILKGSFQQIRSAGIEALRRCMGETVPWMADRTDYLQDWQQISVLSVESSRLKRWYQLGVLLIGDAAHTMSPVGGVGINYAIQDAVEAANFLAGPLAKGKVTLRDLAAFQHRREPAIRVIQRFQSFVQKRIAQAALTSGSNFQLPLMMRVMLRLPFLRDLPARLIAFGLRKVRIKE